MALAKQIILDGEGATKTLWITVENAKNPKSANKIASTIADSPLVKTAFHGADANWGRIMAAIGRSGVKVNPNLIDISLNNILVCKNGEAFKFQEKTVNRSLKTKFIHIKINMKSGKAFSQYATCDLSPKYVEINANYRT